VGAVQTHRFLFPPSWPGGRCHHETCNNKEMQ
jgi:hypothetical protein